MASALRFRVTAGNDRTRGLLDELLGSPLIESAEEVADLTSGMRPDSSSSNLPDDEGPGVHQVRVEYDEDCEETRIRELIARKSSKYDVALEFLERM